MGWLDVKPIAGDTALITTTATSILERWRKAARKRLPELLDSAKARLDEFGRLQYVNQPDIKEARGGLRDSVLVSALAASWLADRPHGIYDEAVERLLDVRDCIHLVAGKDTNLMLTPIRPKWLPCLALPIRLGPKTSVPPTRSTICRHCLPVSVGASPSRLIPPLPAPNIR